MKLAFRGDEAVFEQILPDFPTLTNFIRDPAQPRQAQPVQAVFQSAQENCFPLVALWLRAHGNVNLGKGLSRCKGYSSRGNSPRQTKREAAFLRLDLERKPGRFRSRGMRQLISSGSPFESQVGYSRAVVVGNQCWVAGTTGPNPVTKEFPDSVADQARNALTIIEKALAEGGFALADAVRVTYTITDAAFWDEIIPVLGEVFGTIRPAAACYVAGLVKPEMKIEIELTACREG